MIVRELLGGVYFGERSTTGVAGSRRAVDSMAYSEPEIERIARIAFDLAGKRRKKIVSVDKANVLDSSRLWRDVVNRIAKDFPEIQLSHMYVDSAAMALVSRPADFDVILTENMFGDILVRSSRSGRRLARTVAFGQRRRKSGIVRTNPRLRPGHCGQGHCESAGRDSFRGHAASPFVFFGSGSQSP